MDTVHWLRQVILYMVSIGYGKLRLDSKDIYVISRYLQLEKLINKQEGESISFNSKNEEILKSLRTHQYKIRFEYYLRSW